MSDVSLTQEDVDEMINAVRPIIPTLGDEKGMVERGQVREALLDLDFDPDKVDIFLGLVGAAIDQKRQIN